MLEIECLHCYEILSIPKWVNTDNYDGEIICKKCGSRLAIKFAGSPKPVKYKVVKEGEPHETIFKVEYVDRNDSQP
ncbi:hypothetical protein ACFLXG_00775 [Chloroflexota bacterium]